MKEGVQSMDKEYINYISDIFHNFNMNFLNHLAYYINKVHNNCNTQILINQRKKQKEELLC